MFFLRSMPPCPPCVEVLPELRELVSDLPADRFALVAISVDADRDTVLEFMQDEPMPWTNWHAALIGDLVRTFGVESHPTCLLADEDGRILARTPFMEDRLRATIRSAVKRPLADAARRSG